jgi:WD40 repeat protein
VSEVRSLSFSPDGAWVASGGVDRTVRLWNVGSGAAGASWTAHTDSVSAVTFAPDGRVVSAGGRDRAVRWWTPN